MVIPYIYSTCWYMKSMFYECQQFVQQWFFLLLKLRKNNKGIQSSVPLDAKVAKLQIRVKWLVVMMCGKVAANEWWVRGECYGFELLVLRFLFNLKFMFPLFHRLH
jgi:hypothetical protein